MRCIQKPYVEQMHLLEKVTCVPPYAKSVEAGLVALTEINFSYRKKKIRQAEKQHLANYILLKAKLGIECSRAKNRKEEFEINNLNNKEQKYRSKR